MENLYNYNRLFTNTTTPIVEKYLKIFQEDPKSRIFAPLANAFRKHGDLDEALKVCKEGMKYHPNYISGKVALAHCYYDKGLFVETIEELEPVISNVPDNILANRLLAGAYYRIAEYEKAYKIYKILKQMAPWDPNIKKRIDELEEKLSTKALSSTDLPLEDHETQGISSDFEITEASTISLKQEHGNKKLVSSKWDNFTVIRLYQQQGDFNTAADICEKILDRDPDNKEALKLLVEIRKNKNSATIAGQKQNESRHWKIDFLNHLLKRVSERRKFFE